jgi:hypothetical protein
MGLSLFHAVYLIIMLDLVASNQLESAGDSKTGFADVSLVVSENSLLRQFLDHFRVLGSSLGTNERQPPFCRYSRNEIGFRYHYLRSSISCFLRKHNPYCSLHWRSENSAFHLARLWVFGIEPEIRTGEVRQFANDGMHLTVSITKLALDDPWLVRLYKAHNLDLKARHVPIISRAGRIKHPGADLLPPE